MSTPMLPHLVPDVGSLSSPCVGRVEISVDRIPHVLGLHDSVRNHYGKTHISHLHLGEERQPPHEATECQQQLRLLPRHWSSNTARDCRAQLDRPARRPASTIFCSVVRLKLHLAHAGLGNQHLGEECHAVLLGQDCLCEHLAQLQVAPETL